MCQRNKCSRRRGKKNRHLGETKRERERAARTGTMDIVNLTCCFVAALLYYNTLDAGFVYDDSRAILTNQDVLPTTPLLNLLRNDFWGTPMNHGGSHDWPALCCHWTPPLLRIGVAATGLLFASHPIHVEAVAGVVGRADLAACVFYLSSFLCYVAHVAHRDGVSRQLQAEKQAYKGRYQREHGKYHQADASNPPRRYHYHCHYHHHHDRTRSTSLAVTNETPRQVHGLRQRVVHAHEKRHRSTRDKIKDYLIYFLNRFSGNNLEVKGGTSMSRFRDGGDDVPRVTTSVKQWTAMLGCVWFATCAVFSKETGVTVLGVCAAYDLLIHSRRWRGQRHGDIFNKVRELRHPPQWLIGLRRHFQNRIDNR
uniref:(California timema) hypothetical protein n=1 Tax=Timema californicum TaxID=61474 RepID=A0A7R9J1H1_TIMCA|nr:unnamed protein product [Timema californicum]